MELTNKQLNDLCRLAIQAVQEAGRMISDNTGKGIGYETKEGADNFASQVVTEIDRRSQQIILDRLTPTLAEFDLGLLAEESADDGSRFVKDYFWSIDPMDGTLPFIKDRAGYSVSIALVSRDAVPYIGVVYDPRAHVLYSAVKGAGAYRQNERWFPDLEPAPPYEAVDKGGAVMNGCWVLENPSTYYFKNPRPTQGGGCVWDYAAVACIYNEVGAWATDIYGAPLELNRRESPFMNHKGVIFAGNADVARACQRTPESA
ncbi:MAG: inositol monophosphatase [Candidatus Omnitrophica bacterium]|nr:inositol monophosphatase [Candidatus Omnitrophota bacterium]